MRIRLILGEEPRQDMGPSRWDDPRVRAFLRGITIGALIGAAIAGSRIWERRRKRG
jgi:hypothetical protein